MWQKSVIKEKIDKLLQGQHFLRHVGFEVLEIEENLFSMELTVREIHKQQLGFVHGGVILTIADIVAGFSAYTVAPAEKNVVTADIRVSFLNPGVGGKIYAKGYVLKKGEKLIFCEAEVFDYREDSKVMIAKASATMAII
jgi:uncharacterized protein (TIGR00369 family)